MAFLTPGYVFTTNETVTPTKFHAMVDDAFLLGLIQANLQSGGRMVNIVTPGAPNTGDLRVGSLGLLEAYYSSQWNALPEDPAVLTLTNKSGSDLQLGDVVVPDPTNVDSFTISAVNPAPNVFGVLGENIANNASGSVIVRGECQVKVKPPTLGGLVIPVAAGHILRGPDGTSATADERTAAQISGSNVPRSDAFGVLLIAVSSVSPPLTTAPATCYIWR